MSAPRAPEETSLAHCETRPGQPPVHGGGLLASGQDIVVISTADWDHWFWTNNQHTALRLAKTGFRVLYVESLGLRRPALNRRDVRRLLARLVNGLRGVRRVGERIWVHSPLVIPFHGNPTGRRINGVLLSESLKLLTRWLGFSRPVIWAYNPLLHWAAQRLNASMLVYHCVDDLAASPGMPASAIRAAEKEMFSAADAIFTTSRGLQDRCAREAPGRTYYFPNVSDFEHFSQARTPGPIPDDLATIPQPRIGFIGAVSSYKLDFELIGDVARQRPDWHWALIGQVGEGQPDTSVDLLRRPNIHLLGPKRYERLPDYFRGLDVGVLPCAVNDYTRSMFPMKFFEYLAAGKPIVSTRLEALQEFSHLCYLTDSVEAFVEALQRALMGDVPDPALCLRAAQHHTWEWRLGEMLRILERHGAWKGRGVMDAATNHTRG